MMAPVNLRLNPIGTVIFVVGFLLTLVYLFGMPDIFKGEQRVSMKELLTVSIKLAQRGGMKAKEVYQQHKRNQLNANPTVKGKTKSKELTKDATATEMLTNGDLESHRAIFYGFSKMCPGIKVLSEEHDNKPVDLNQIKPVENKIDEVEEVIKSDQSIPVSRLAIWIDALDATQEYTASLTDYVTTMVCVVVDGEPKIGVINRPFHDETFWAWDGYGHSKNLKQADATEQSTVEKRHSIIVSHGDTGTVKEVAKGALGEDVKIISAGGAGYKTLEVIKGDVNAYAHISLIKKWDICAGNAILNALGGRLTTLDGDYVDYSPFLQQKNERGLLATVNSNLHYLYLEKLGPKVEDVMKNKRTEKSHR